MAAGAAARRAGTVQHMTTASVTAARREAEIMKGTPGSQLNRGRRLNLTPTYDGFRLRPLSPDSNVIDTNYDGTTAGKKWQLFAIRSSAPESPLSALWASLAGNKPCGAGGPFVGGPGLDHRAGGREPVFRASPSRGSTPSPISPMERPRSAVSNSRPPRPARSGVSAMRATARPLSPIRIFTGRSSAATTRSIWPAA